MARIKKNSRIQPLSIRYLYDIHWMGSINMNEYEVSLKNVAVNQVWGFSSIFFNISTSITKWGSRSIAKLVYNSNN